MSRPTLYSIFFPCCFRGFRKQFDELLIGSKQGWKREGLYDWVIGYYPIGDSDDWLAQTASELIRKSDDGYLCPTTFHQLLVARYELAGPQIADALRICNSLDRNVRHAAGLI